MSEHDDPNPATIEAEALAALSELEALEGMAPDSAHVPAIAGQSGQGVQPKPLPMHSVEADRADHLIARQTMEDVPALASTVARTKPLYPHAEPLAEDVFQALYQAFPKQQPVCPEAQANARAIEEMMHTADYERLHNDTQYDELCTAIGASHLHAALVKKLLEQKPPEQQPQGGQGDGQPQGGEGAGQGGGQGGQGQPGQQPDQGQGGQGQGQGQSPEQQAQDASQRQELRVAARAAAKQARQEIQETREALAAFGDQSGEPGMGWGLTAGIEHQEGDVASRIAHAKRIRSDARLRRIAALAGRMRPLAEEAQKRRTEHASDEIVGIEIGDDLERVLPSEMMLAAHPVFRMDFIRRWAEGALLQYEMRGNERIGKGPIVLAVDESGSMRGTPSEWAMAIFLLYRSIAAKQRRDLRIIHFGLGPSNIAVEDYPKGQGSPEQVMATCTHFFGGGTSYEEWMEKALEAIQTSKYNKADVVVITDDICGVQPDRLLAWQKAKAERQFRTYGILLGTSRSFGPLKELCDEVQGVPNLAGGSDDTSALNMAFNV